jgi:hypothetical protein
MKEIKPKLIIGPPRCGTTILMKTLGCLNNNEFAISEPWRVFHGSGENILLDCYVSGKSRLEARYERWRKRKYSILDSIDEYKLNAIFKETCRFHVYDDPVNADILKAVLSKRFEIIGCIRNPYSVITSIYYRFHDKNHRFYMANDQIKKVAENLESFLCFCKSFSIPVVKYEDFVSSFEHLKPFTKESPIKVNSKINNITLYGIGDAQAFKSSFVHKNDLSDRLDLRSREIVSTAFGEELSNLYRTEPSNDTQ